MPRINMFWMAARYLTSRRNHYASFVNWVSFAGLALGVAADTLEFGVLRQALDASGRAGRGEIDPRDYARDERGGVRRVQ